MEDCICKRRRFPCDEELHTLVERQEQLKKDAEAAAQAVSARIQAVIAAMPLLERLTFAQGARCDCGAGLAYDPAGESGKSMQGYWDCSAILLGTADQSVPHSARYPFAFYDIKSERQYPGNQTTRPQ